MAERHGREIIFDTETTGLSPVHGDRVVDIACVELFDLMPTGNEFQVYIDPERDMPTEAFEVHGLSRDFLRGKPKFGDVAEAFLEFIGDAPLIAHNAQFDVKFINAELAKVKRPPLVNRIIDTMAISRRMFPGAKASQDDLCRRFQIDMSSRTKHGALIDTRLLARVYLELMGGRERRLALGEAAVPVDALSTRPFRSARPSIGNPSESEMAAHAAFLSNVKKPIWDKPAEPEVSAGPRP